MDAALQVIRRAPTTTLVHPAMPLEDAAHLASFLIELTMKFIRFSSAHATVAGEIEVAAISKHEGFWWVSRKDFVRPDVRDILSGR